MSVGRENSNRIMQNNVVKMVNQNHKNSASSALHRILRLISGIHSSTFDKSDIKRVKHFGRTIYLFAVAPLAQHKIKQ